RELARALLASRRPGPLRQLADGDRVGDVVRVELLERRRLDLPQLDGVEAEPPEILVDGLDDAVAQQLAAAVQLVELDVGERGAHGVLDARGEQRAQALGRRGALAAELRR